MLCKFHPLGDTCVQGPNVWANPALGAKGEQRLPEATRLALKSIPVAQNHQLLVHPEHGRPADTWGLCFSSTHTRKGIHIFLVCKSTILAMWSQEKVMPPSSAGTPFFARCHRENNQFCSRSNINPGPVDAFGRAAT